VPGLEPGAGDQIGRVDVPVRRNAIPCDNAVCGAVRTALCS
jgi:CRISPR/Cas system CMR subunit Cmr4 (Cas7 group RAMP superfamily)